MSSPIRLSGYASGLDTDSIIKELMQVERAPLNKLNQQKQKIAWKRDAYREMNTHLTTIRNLTDKMRFSSAYNKQTAVSSDTSVVTATTSSTATSGGYTIKVNSLATSALVTGNNVSVDLKAKVNSSEIVGDGKFEVVGKDGRSIEVTVTADSTYESVLKQVNSANIGVSMSYDSINKRFMLSSTSTGASASVMINDTSGTAASLLKLSTPATLTGTNATVELNGKEMILETNSFEFNGVRFDLKGVSTTTASVSVSRDTTGIVDQIKGFVEQYNSLVDKVNSLVKTVPNRNYAPLSDEEKEAMTDKQIDLWETKAKSGVLYRDSILQDTLSLLRSSLISNVKGLDKNMDSLSDIGITFKGYTQGLTSELGKLTIDENKLKEAVSNNPDGVMDLFSKSSSLDPKDKNYQSEIGYAERLYNNLSTQINKIIKQIGSGAVSDLEDNSQLGKQIGDINDKINTVNNRLQTVENRYYKQFTAMELAIQKLNSRGSWLGAQLGQ